MGSTLQHECSPHPILSLVRKSGCRTQESAFVCFLRVVCCVSDAPCPRCRGKLDHPQCGPSRAVWLGRFRITSCPRPQRVSPCRFTLHGSCLVLRTWCHPRCRTFLEGLTWPASLGFSNHKQHVLSPRNRCLCSHLFMVQVLSWVALLFLVEFGPPSMFPLWLQLCFLMLSLYSLVPHVLVNLYCEPATG